jgi:hypothetical protein
MGKYRVIIFADANGNSLGQFTLQTSVGPVVMIFGNTDHLMEVMTYAQRFLPPSAQLGTIDVTADSPAQVISLFEKRAPGWTAQMNFVSDEEESFDALLAEMRKQT